MLKMRNIHKSYRIGPSAVDVLQGIDLDVAQGELLSIMGKSGSGKSTLMHIIGLLDSADKGIYQLDGKDIKEYKDKELSSLRNRKIGFVFQSFYLLSKLNALDNVGLPLIYRNMNKKHIRELGLHYLQKVNMAERALHKPNELSGGQQQRVAIARALVGKPSLILADEPTGALDTRVGKEIMDLFVQLNEEDGITVIIITHDPGVAARCRRTIHMHDGVLGEDAEE
jgi:putative ABC transport system ATP-binding protein